MIRAGMANAGWIGAALFVALIPDVAAACPVCFDARDENRMAFILSTAFMTLLPLAMLGFSATWVVRRIREMEGDPQRAPIDESPRHRPHDHGELG